MLFILYFGSALFHFETSGQTLNINNYFSISSAEYTYTFKYIGGSRIEDGVFGSSRIGHSKGTFAISNDEKEMWVTGHWGHFSIGSFRIDKLSKTTFINELPIAKNISPFVKICPLVTDNNKPNIVTGIEYVDDKLFVNVAKAYDAAGKNVSTTMVFEDVFNLAGSKQFCYFAMEGKAHAAGWMSSIPEKYQESLNAIYVTGYASNIPINNRLSIGPTLFTWFPFYLNAPKESNQPIFTENIIDYSLSKPLEEDRYNKSGKNNVWTELSKAYYGKIMPKTGEYLIFGVSGGHKSGIGYKIRQDNGAVCPGPCAFEHNDYYNYFWVYDITEQNSQLKPTSWGNLPIFKHKRSQFLIGGADYLNGKVFFIIKNADSTQSKYEKMPLLLVYDIDISKKTK